MEVEVGERTGTLGTWIQQLTCSLSGHDEMFHFEKNRVSLVCVSCGHESRGWEISGRQPVVTVRGDRQRHRLAGPRLVEPRRAA